MELQTAALAAELDDRLEFVFLQGTVEGEEPADEDVRSLSDPPFFEWWSHHDATEAELRDAVRYVAKYIKRCGPFEVLIGFSQGAAIVSALMWEAQQVLAGSSGLPTGSLPALPGSPLSGLVLPGLVICVGGVNPPARLMGPPAASGGDAEAGRREFHKISVPSVHVIGCTDLLKDRAVQLAWNWYTDGREALEDGATDAACVGHTRRASILYHPRGHAFPADPAPLAELISGRLASLAWAPAPRSPTYSAAAAASCEDGLYCTGMCSLL